MRKQSLLLFLVAALLTVRAISQEIVIEPTNGRAQTANRVSRPAAEPSAPAEPKKLVTKPAANSAGKSAEQGRAAKAKKVRAEQIAAKREATPAPAKPADAEAIKADAGGIKSDEATSAAKMKPETRPAWAMADTRDAVALQREIADALARDPKLVSSTFQVSVNENSVTLEGHAAGPQEHLQAQRLAQSYAWNRKLVDHIDVSPRMSAQK